MAENPSRYLAWIEAGGDHGRVSVGDSVVIEKFGVIIPFRPPRLGIEDGPGETGVYARIGYMSS